MSERLRAAQEILNVYFFALYDADDHQAHSGLTAAICEASVRSDIAGNYIAPRYVTVHRVPEMVGVVDGRGEVHLMQRSGSKEEDVISCETCALHGKCQRDWVDGLECCMDWQSKRKGKRKHYGR